MGVMVRNEPEAVRITTATRGRSHDIDARQRRYIISMTIRTLCFLLAVLSMGHWFMWVFLAASLFLPYVAVVLANAGATPDPGGPEAFLDEQRPVLEPPPVSGPV
ncbi:hypothetical protein BH18ACT9_BH18ACT9_09110 [soil metagenome]